MTQLILSSESPAWAGLAPFAAMGFHGARGLKKLVFDLVCSIDVTVPLSPEAQAEVAGCVDRLLHLATLDSSTGNAPPSRAMVTLHAVMAYIRTNLKDAQLSVDTVARNMGCSRRTIHRLFRATGGESMERFLWRQRVEACAVEMARCDTRPISLTELADRYGFSSLSSFSTAFRRVHGVSPSQWRAVCRAAAAGCD